MRDKVIIIGAGISGLAAAWMLYKNGYQVTVYEQADELRSGGAGLSLWPNATHVLEQMGLWESLKKRSQLIQTAEICTKDGKRLAGIPSSQFGTTAGILRSELYHGFLQHMPGVQFRTASQCIAIEETEACVTAKFANGHEDAASLLIGADGIRSTVRSVVSGTTRLRNSGFRSWLGVAKLNLPKHFHHHAFEIWGIGLRVGCLPVSSNEVYWFVTERCRATLNQDMDHLVDDPKTYLGGLLQGYHTPVQEVLEHTHPDSILLKEIWDLKPIKHWVSGRIALVGDAAHAATPNLGQGACMALEDAWILAQCLQSSGTLSERLKRYEQVRMGRTRMVASRSWWFGQLSQLDQPWLYALRNWGMKWIPSRLQQLYYQDIIQYQASKANMS